MRKRSQSSADSETPSPRRADPSQHKPPPPENPRKTPAPPFPSFSPRPVAGGQSPGATDILPVRTEYTLTAPMEPARISRLGATHEPAPACISPNFVADFGHPFRYSIHTYTHLWAFAWERMARAKPLNTASKFRARGARPFNLSFVATKQLCRLEISN
jgi:hypothetical protein